MTDKVMNVLIGGVGVILGAIVAFAGVGQLADLVVERAGELGEIKAQILEQEQELLQRNLQLADQQASLSNLRDRLRKLAERATGLEEDEAVSRRLGQLEQLSAALEQAPQTQVLLSLKDRVDALTNPSLLRCSIVDTAPLSSPGSCMEHNDWMPPAACPLGKSVRSIDVVARRIDGDWVCGFRVECCSNVGTPVELAGN